MRAKKTSRMARHCSAFETTPSQETKGMDVNILELSIRASHALENAGIKTIEELAIYDWSKFAEQRGVGIKTIAELATLTLCFARGVSLLDIAAGAESRRAKTIKGASGVGGRSRTSHGCSRRSPAHPNIQKS